MAIRFWLTLGVVAAGSVGATQALIGCSSDDDKKNAADGTDAGDATTTTTDPDATNGDGDVPADAGPPPTEKQVCEAYLHAACTRRLECGLGGSLASCEGLSAYCPDYFFAAGSTRTIEGMIACTEARRTQPCDEVERGIDPACATAGTRQGGEPCVVNAQCASFRCSSNYTCGTCLTLKAPNTGCPVAGETCGQNKECTNSDAGCVPIPTPARLPVGAACGLDAGTDGGSCSNETPCAAPTAQTNGTCSVRPSSGPCLFRVGQPTASVCSIDTTCLRVDPGIPGGECVGPGAKDALCGQGYGGRSCAEGFFCTDTNNKGTCQPRHKENETCTSTTQCEPTLYCQRQSVSLGTCVPRVAVGAKCGQTSFDGGPPFNVECQAGSTCTQVLVGDATYENLCIQSGTIGAPCGAPNQGCYGTLVCKSGTCAIEDCPKDAGPG